MKTLFIVAERNVDAHEGEEYDSILEVEDQPTTQTIEELANRVRGRIRKLWEEQGECDDRRVEVHLAAASPFNAMLIDLQLIMGEAEGIMVDLPYLDSTERQTDDPETLEVLKRLESDKLS
jgi:hypothetical protein